MNPKCNFFISLLLIALICLTSLCAGQTELFYIKPIQTDSAYTSDQDSHMVVVNQNLQLNKLFLFLGGTGSHTKLYQTLSNFAGNLGYHVINLSYPNEVAAATLGNSVDSLVFDKYRQEVCFGTAISEDVEVDSLNAIQTRTIKLLQYLSDVFPDQNWDQYLIHDTTLNWPKIAVGGHSQGGGHACYIAKFNEVDRVLMFSSPNDYSNHFDNAANWLRTPGVTSIEKHFAYLSLLDEIVDLDKQLINLKGLGLYPLYDTTHVDETNSPFNGSHFLYTTQSPGIAILYHNSTTKFSLLNNDVWEYMLSTKTSSSIHQKDTGPRVQVYPNPANKIIRIEAPKFDSGSKYQLFNLYGQDLTGAQQIDTNPFKLDLSDFNTGIYILLFDNQVIKIIKL